MTTPRPMMKKSWNSFMRGILGMPGAKIDREEFLRKTFNKLPEEQMQICLTESPLMAVGPQAVEKAAESVIAHHTLKVSAISAVSGIPGGLAMLATIPADLANYYYHIVAVGQKLGYLYGYPDMLDTKDHLTPEGEMMLTAFIGVMNKVTAARELIKKIAVEAGRRISEETATRVAGNLLSKQLISQSTEFIARKLGTQITAKSGGRVLTKAIPIVSGVICGTMTYATFRQQARRLHEALKETATT